MFPIHVKTYTEGTVPSDYGYGVLSDAISCTVTEERNGAYELELVYPVNGKHSEHLTVNSLVKAKPNFTDDPQLFRIYKVGKSINGQVTYFAQHVSYDLSGKVITTGSAGSCSSACALLQAQAGNFTITTDKNVNGTFTITEPSSVRSWFGGKAGSLLDVYGTGEWYYNNFVCTFKAARGQDRGVTIRYGKNLTDLSQELDLSNLATGIIPFYLDTEGNKTVGSKVSTGISLTPIRDRAVDFSDSVDPESATPITTQLATLATNYVNNNDFVNVSNSITLSFVQLKELTERVDLCDTVHIYFEALGITATAKCIATTWDVLEERYTTTTFGNARTNIADTIATQQKEIKEAPSKSFMNEAIRHATDLITGNLGGYVILHDTNGDDEPDEILIMNTDDISTATKVWRWNSGGLGYSSTGYSGPYGLAMTADGEIVADFISTGTLNANLIKAGVIEDVNGNSSIDMSTGLAKLYYLIAKYMLRVQDSNGVSLATVEAGANGGLVAVGLPDTTQVGTLYANTNGGNFDLRNTSGNIVLFALADTDGGTVKFKNNNQVDVCVINANVGGGNITINDENGQAIGSLWTLTDHGVLSLGRDNGTTTVSLSGGGNAYGGDLALGDENGTTLSRLFAGANGGRLEIYEAGGNKTGAFYSGTYGGVLNVYNTSAQSRASIMLDSNDSAILDLKTSSAGTHVYILAESSKQIFAYGGTQNIILDGSTGEIICDHVTQTSSRKVKENIKPIEDARKILDLEAVSFDYKEKNRGTDQRGFIAEDVKKVLPNLVKDEREDIPTTLDYIQMIPYLQSIIKDQEKRIKALEEKINGTN